MHVKTTISNWQGVSYSLPVIVSNLLIAPISIVQGVYAKHYAITLSSLAAIVLLSRVFDAITDPLIGYYSDRYRSEHGTRKPFIFCGSLLLFFSAYFLYVPQGEVTSIYVMLCFIAFYMAFTLFEIPHVAWPCDITVEPSERAKIYSFRVVASYCGLLIFYSIPLLPFFETTEITPETLKITFFVALGLGVPFILQAMRYVPVGKYGGTIKDQGVEYPPESVRFLMAEMAGNKPLIIFAGAFLCGGFSVGMWYGLIYIYVDIYLDMGDKFAEMFLIAFVIGILVAPIWYKLSIAVGNKLTWVIIVLLLIASFVFTGTLAPGEVSFMDLLVLKTIQTSALVGSGIVVPSVLSGIVDYSYLKYGKKRSAMYFSIKVFFEKFAGALGASVALLVASLSGFDTIKSEYTPEAIFGLKVAIAVVPTLLALGALVFVLCMPIGEREVVTIRAKLNKNF